MQTKPLYVFSLLTIAIFLLAADSLFADIATLKHIAEAEQDVSYVGLRLKTRSTSNGARTMEEVVIHKTAENSYRKVVSIVGQQKSLAEENRREKNRDDKNKDRERDDRRRGREFRWERQRSQFSIKEIELIAQNYDLELRRWGEKIAGHETDLLIINPKHVGRPTKHIYFARKNGVILRVEDLDAAGVLRNMFVYTRISFDPEDVEKKWKSSQKEIKPAPRRELPAISLADAKKILKTKPIEPTYLPPGFQLQNTYKLQYGDRHPIRLKYTDGLLDFSIFETTGKLSNRFDRERGTEIKIGDKTVRKYQSDPYHAFRWSSSGIHFYLLGPLPAAELQKVVESIVNKTEQK